MDSNQKPAEGVVKKLYVVRHGETNFNREERSQGPDAELSSLGRIQTGHLAMRFGATSVDNIISSDMKRAEETAEAIATITGHTILYSELFREMKQPSEVVGKFFVDSLVVEARNQMRINECVKTWHYSDEENAYDLYARALLARRFLEACTETNSVVVSHGIFISMLFCTLLTESEIAAMVLYFSFRHRMHLDNTGITVFEHGMFGGNLCWRMCVWNDHAHLG